MMPMLTRTHTDDADIDQCFFKGVHTMSSEGVNSTLTQAPAKQLTILIPSMFFQHVI
jgi:hypothetical protein